MTSIIITQHIPAQTIARLQAAGPTVAYHDRLDPLPPDDLRTAVLDADAVICLLTDRMTTEVMGAAPRLRIIANVAVGYDNIDVAAARERGILVTNTPDILTETTADLAWALLLAVARRIPEADAFMRAGRYTRFELMPPLAGADVHGKTLGVVGLGRIGTAVARRGALGFGMPVLYTASSPRPEADRGLGARHVSFATLLAESDFISIHVPLNDTTRHLVGSPQFRAMKRSAFLINTSRGPVVDEAALARALADGEIAGAALDVFEDEPRLHPDLVTMRDRLVVAPHIGSATVETRQAMADLAADNVLAVLGGGEPLTPVG